MKLLVAITASIVAFAFAGPASATSVSQREYRRGYNDCLAGRFDQEQHGASYKRGCRAAEDKRASPGACPADVSEADRYKYPACAGGAPSRQRTHARAGFSDVQGMDSIKAFDAMTAKGFTSVDSITTGNTIYGIYYNRATHQCVQLSNADGRVVDARDIGTHPNCK